MADRETIIDTRGDSGGTVIAAIVLLAVLVFGALWFTGVINFNRAPATSSVTVDLPAPAPNVIEVPAPAPNVTITTPQN